jgi:hypothetical protein
MDPDLTNDDKKSCVFTAPYKRIGRNWIRIGSPCIDLDMEIGEENLPERYKDPQVAVMDPQVKGMDGNPVMAIVRVYDEKAIDLSREDLLGDYGDAAKRCEAALLKRFPGDFLTNGSLNEW